MKRPSWKRYTQLLNAAARRHFAKRVPDPKWYWAPWNAYRAGYRDGQRDAHSQSERQG